jgi:glutamate/tyrosine decarboxylase-like PLP-dependent enzyme
MPPPNVFESALNAAVQHAIEHVSPSNDRSVGATASLESLRAKIDVPLNDAGIDSVRVIDELVHSVEGGIINCAGPRFFGWVIGGALPSALAADWLTSAWDQNAGLYNTAPAAALVEETAGRWLKELLGLPTHASFAFVTGCQMAHATCLAAARNAVLARTGWNVERQGIAGSPPIRVLTSTEFHSTIPRSIRLLGIGEGQIVSLPVDDAGRLRADALLAALKEAAGIPTIVVLQAGDVNTGTFDDFESLIPIAKNFGAWVHIDGAFGLWAAASPKLRHFTKGVAEADSWATDGHKWLNVPYDSGYAFVADTEAHRRSFTGQAVYASSTSPARNPLDWTPEFSRRARGFATYAALRELGRDGVADRTHLPTRPRPGNRHRRADRRGACLGASDQPGTGRLPRPHARSDLHRSRPPNRRGHRPHHGLRRSDVYRNHLARPSPDAHQRQQLAHCQRRCGPGGAMRSKYTCRLR